MKKILTRSIATAAALALMCTSSAFAGTWTHIDKDGYDWGSDSSYWSYIKDNGAYAENEWVDDNGTWYWLGDYGMLPYFAGIAKDGCLYNSDGIYVPTNDGVHHFVDRNMYAQLSDGMSADQVNAILGQPHELYSSSSSDYGLRHYDYAAYIWYTSDAKSDIYVYYTNGVVSSFSAYWN